MSWGDELQQGREWELLVAQLESLFALPGFRVQSPENIRGRAGNIVKVDVTVRGRIGTQDVLIAFECRDRNARAGVDWIQQVVGRRESIGASEYVVVSREPFTEDARLEAAFHGISLRTLERQDLTSVTALVLGLELELCRARYRATQIDFQSLRLQPFGIELTAAEWPKFTPERLQEILDHPNERRLIDRFTMKPVSVTELVKEADWASAFEGGPFEGRKMYTARLFSGYQDEHGETGRLLHWLDDGYGVRLDGLGFTGEVWWDREPVAMSQVVRYSSEDGALAVIAEFDLVELTRFR